MLGRPGLGHQGRAARPFAAHADAEQDSECRQLGGGVRQTARGGEHRVDDHAGHERARSAVPIGDDAEEEAAGGGGKERGRTDGAGGLPRDAQVGDDRREEQRVEHHVERVEHPAERRRDERALRVRRSIAPPAEEPATDRRSSGDGRRWHHPRSTWRRHARTAMPPCSSPSRSRRVSSAAPGVSPCTQSVSTGKESVDPSVAVT